jgi:uncharacterized protein YaiE (UPF0345 family)
MATGFPAATGDVLSAAMFNGLVAFTLDVQTGATYTLEATDQYQVLVITSNAGTKTVSIPTDATYNFPVGTAITILNTGAGLLTINAVTSGTTTVTSAGVTSNAPTVSQYKTAVAIKTAANAWTVVGAVA